jgi:23S rRNA (cytosine1962-C5)-methyltransferase
VTAIVSPRGEARWTRGHPWIFRSDLLERPDAPAGVVPVTARNGRPLGEALWSPSSEIALRFLTRPGAPPIDGAWWRHRLEGAIARRAPLVGVTTAMRLVHGEGDGLPSLVVDRYDRWLVVQLLSAGLASLEAQVVPLLLELTGCEGVLARHDVGARRREGLDDAVRLLAGDVPRAITVMEHGVRYVAAPWDGQKTGAFLDQRENRALVGALARGRALDCFAYHGSFALHLARRASDVVALDISGAALDRARTHAAENGLTNVATVEADAFEWLRDAVRRGERFETIVVDPPAFAKSRAAIPQARRGYADINRLAMKLLAPGGTLFSASCSHHIDRSTFLAMLAEAAADSGRRLELRGTTGHALDHPELLTIPETGYLKGAVLVAQD